MAQFHLKLTAKYALPDVINTSDDYLNHFFTEIASTDTENVTAYKTIKANYESKGVTWDYTLSDDKTNVIVSVEHDSPNILLEYTTAVGFTGVNFMAVASTYFDILSVKECPNKPDSEDYFYQANSSALED